ncbi:MAG: hypothetical protein H7195_07510 [Chryseobacterium sp.]|nr:hypothetical protein [Chryseobacterium sp.]
MQFIKIYALFVILIITSCKKERTCQCTNSTATYDAGTLDATKKYAKKYCEDMSNAETECKLKE